MQLPQMYFFVTIFLLVVIIEGRRNAKQSDGKTKLIRRKVTNGRRRESLNLGKTTKSTAIVPVPKKSLKEKVFHGIETVSSAIISRADTALSSTKRLKRQLKSYFSSDYEVLLLRLTFPDESRPTADDVDRFIATIDTFVRNVDVTSQSNPYRVTLRKLWQKAAESDGRTVIKTLLMLHTILRNAAPEDSLIFKTLLSKMSREQCKKSKCKYFDMRKVLEVSTETVYLQDFIDRYSTYVLKRARTFTSEFEEMKLIDGGMRTEDICAQLMKAYKLLDAGLNCRATKVEECELVLACLELVVRDMRELFTLFHQKLLWVVKEDEVGDIFKGWEEAEVRAVLSHFKNFYNDRFDLIQSFLLEVGEALEIVYGISIPTDLDQPALFSDCSTGETESGGSSSFDPEAAASRAIPSVDSDLGAVTETSESDISHPRRSTGRFDPAAGRGEEREERGRRGGLFPSIIDNDSGSVREITKQQQQQRRRRPRAEAILRQKKSPLIDDGDNDGREEEDNESSSSYEDWELPSSSTGTYSSK